MNGRPTSQTYPCQVPIYAPGKEPLPPGFTEEDRAQLMEAKKWEGYMGMAMESCIVKTVLAGGAGAFSMISPVYIIFLMSLRLQVSVLEHFSL